MLGAEKAIPEPGNVSGNTSWKLRNLEPGVYAWTVKGRDNAFNSSPPAQGIFAFGVADVEVPGGAPRAFAWSSTGANPIRRTDSARLTLSVDREQRVTVAVYDVRGSRVATLHDGLLTAKEHSFALDARGLPSGAYFVRAAGKTQTATARVVVLH